MRAAPAVTSPGSASALASVASASASALAAAAAAAAVAVAASILASALAASAPVAAPSRLLLVHPAVAVRQPHQRHVPGLRFLLFDVQR